MNLDINKKFMLATIILLVTSVLTTIYLDIEINFINIISAIIMLYLGLGSATAYKKNNSKIQLMVTYIYFFAFFLNVFSGIYLGIYNYNEDSENSVDSVYNIDEDNTDSIDE
ncbi:MAG: hypothetical protein R3Y29_03210 [bacterium]